MKYSIICLSIFVLLFCSTTEALVHTKKAFNHTSWGEQTFYYEYLPPGYGNGTKFPALIFLHGAGESANGPCSFSTLERVTDNGGTPPNYIKNNVWPLELPFIVISPQAPWGHGPVTSEIAVRIVKEAYATHADLNRIYVTGLSQGGGAVWQLIAASLTNARNVAAVVPICGSVGPTSPSNYTSIVDANVPIWAFHAVNDGAVNINQTSTAWINGLNGAGLTPAPKYTIFQSGGHYIWGNVYETNRAINTQNYIYDWLLSYSRSPSSSTTSTTGPASTSTTSTTTGSTTTGSTTTGGSGTCGGGPTQTFRFAGNCTLVCN
ncbi:hypothetical protein DLAC_11784 [Tieghemostelium lacteum]|uniref:Phospholipase/carboxylesterase/thioesterase domain-containing protein n=1 Tax=Tieghemostelium lacteum TaxID=361077 RepID=A0A151Z746_TIELA|nr:hypothetical protein DLAC_11784 [Tieghemostelium lacteum]|eukprot:KYQ89758.1 hypothetical protein DLAC_11784 [Tieghemostelium lacteum]